MSVVLDLVIKTILNTQFCQLRLCQYVCQERLWISVCHLRGGHSIYEHRILRLHLAQILAPRSLRKILHHVAHVLLDPLIHLPPTKMFVHSKKAW